MSNSNIKITRYYSNLSAYLKPNKVLVIYGPRQVGKTTRTYTPIIIFGGHGKEKKLILWRSGKENFSALNLSGAASRPSRQKIG